MATRTLTVNLVGRTKSLERAFDRSSKSAGSMASGITRATRVASKALLGLGGVFVGAAFAAKPLVDAAVDVQESLSKNTVVFGQAAEGVAAFADTAADALGMSRRQALEATGTFGTLAAAMKIPEAQAADMSVTMTQLAADMASFNNASPEETLIALQSGLRGEAEPLRRFGVLLDAATMKQEALKQGLIDNEKMALTPSQKALAAYGLILEQTKIQQGDFERTSDGLANTQRRLSANFEDVKEKLGAILLPAFESAAAWLEASGLPAIEGFVDGIGDLGDSAFLQGVANNLGELWTGLSTRLGDVADSPKWGILEDAFGDIPEWAGDALADLDEIDWADVGVGELLDVFGGIAGDLEVIFARDVLPGLGLLGGEVAGELTRSIGLGIAEGAPEVAAEIVHMFDDIFGTRIAEIFGIEGGMGDTAGALWSQTGMGMMIEWGTRLGLGLWEGFTKGIQGPESDFGRAPGAAVGLVRGVGAPPGVQDMLSRTADEKLRQDIANELFGGGVAGGDVMGPMGVSQQAAIDEVFGFISGLGPTTTRTPNPEITINMPPGSDGDDVVGALSRWVQLNGPLPPQLTGVG